MSVKDFKARLDEISKEEIDISDMNEFEEKVLKLEEDIAYEIGGDSPNEGNQMQALLKKIKNLKKGHDFYDAEAELDNMFPNRHDDDFDEESTSYDSVFGKD
jgi:hypothetical protein